MSETVTSSCGCVFCDVNVPSVYVSGVMHSFNGRYVPCARAPAQAAEDKQFTDLINCRWEVESLREALRTASFLIEEIVDREGREGMTDYDFAEQVIALAQASRDKIRAALSHPPADGEGWQTMETAPKDGTPILLWSKTKIDRNYTVRDVCDYYAIGFWMYGGWKSIEVEDCGTMGGEYTGWMPDWVSLDVDATHWRPLPAPPTASPPAAAPTTEELDKLQFGRVLHKRPEGT